MNKTYIHEKLCEILKREDILIDEPMKNHTSFKIGGPCDFLVIPRNYEEIRQLVLLCNKENIPFFVIGNGSNLLVRDGGIRGIVIQIGENLSDFEIEDNIIRAKSGILLSKLAKNIIKESLSGFEFASGIPGSLGGAVAMNAGAYGGEMKQVVKSVKLLDMKGNIKDFSNEEMEFGYRRSMLSDNRYIVLEIELELQKGNYEDIKVVVDDLNFRRTSKQPLNLPSAGSTFKRPEGHYAGQLIEEAGLKGLTFRDAQVSPKHCGFVVNLGDAKANDIIELLDIIKKTVYDKYKVKLEEEIKIIGEDL